MTRRATLLPRTISAFRLFHLPEELIELVLSYLGWTALNHFRTAFGVVFQEYLSSMRNLQCVKFDPMRALAASRKSAIGWVNDDEKSGHVAIIEFSIRVTQNEDANHLHQLFKTVESQHLPGLRFDIYVAPAMVGEPVLQQMIPTMSKFAMEI
ncbi:hypothetical protein GQ42DRAFT_155984 [Ramicandelaber brevisporus]|nr:hypothetical protein GQ42DRAFT_155984 [Ramicandelaber brevisporus]